MYLIVMLVFVCLDLCLQTIIILEKCPTALMKIIASSDSSETGRWVKRSEKKCLFSSYCVLHHCFILSIEETEKFLKENMENEPTWNF